jgi:hypothetical protein
MKIRDVVIDLLRAHNMLHGEFCGFSCICHQTVQTDLDDKYNPLLAQHGEDPVVIPDNYFL